MADVPGRPIHLQAEQLMQAATTAAGHLETSATPPTAAAPHLAVPAAPVDAAAAEAAAAIHMKTARLSTELAPKAPAMQQAATAAAMSLQAQDATNAARMPGVPSVSPGGSGSGVQMLGGGPGGVRPAPQAPSLPVPRNPGRPQPPPPPPPGAAPPHTPDARLRHTPPPSWTHPAPAENSAKAQQQYKQILDDIKEHNSWRPDQTNAAAVSDYNDEARFLNATKQSLEDQMNGWGAPYDPSDMPASDAHTPLGTPAKNPPSTRQPPTVRQETSGEPGNWNPDLNLQHLQPNTEYVVDGKYHFWTDDQGLVKSVQMDVNDPISAGHRSGFGPPGKIDGDHSGHLVPRRFGGPGESINLTGQDAFVNLSTVKKIENQWWAIYQAKGSVDAEIEIIRDATGRPLQYIYEWQNMAGEWVEETIPNLGR